MVDAKQRITRRMARGLRDGDIADLGTGLPIMITNYLSGNIHITPQSESGFLGLGPVTTTYPDPMNADGQSYGILPGVAISDSAMSFVLTHGGRIDVCVLGGL